MPLLCMQGMKYNMIAWVNLQVIALFRSFWRANSVVPLLLDFVFGFYELFWSPRSVFNNNSTVVEVMSTLPFFSPLNQQSCMNSMQILFPCLLTKKLWKRPHYELDKYVTLQELNMSSPSNKCVQAPAMGWGFEVDVTAHDHAMLRVSSDLVQAAI